MSKLKEIEQRLDEARKASYSAARSTDLIYPLLKSVIYSANAAGNSSRCSAYWSAYSTAYSAARSAANLAAWSTVSSVMERKKQVKMIKEMLND